MQKRLLAGMASFVLVFLLITPSSLAASEPNILIENIEPQPAAPGDAVTFHLLAQNLGTDSEQFQALETETADKIQVLGRSSLKSDFELCGGCQKVVKFYVKVSEEADSGTYPVEFRLITSKSGIGIIEKSTIVVDGEPNLQVSAEEIEVEQGGSTKFNLTATNIGTDAASEVVLELSNDDISVQPSSLALGSIEVGEIVNETISIRTDDSLAAGVHKLRVDASYRDENQRGNKTSSLTIYVLKKAELSVSSLKIEDATIGQATEAIIEVENQGPGEAEQVVSSLSCRGANLENEKAFIGQLDNEESVPMVFRLTPQTSDVGCSLELSYTDSEVRTISDTFTFSASSRQPPILPAAAALVLVGGLIFYYWRHRGQDETEEV